MSRRSRTLHGLFISTAAVVATKWIVKACSKAVKKMKTTKKNVEPSAPLVSHPLHDIVEEPVGLAVALQAPVAAVIEAPATTSSSPAVAASTEEDSAISQPSITTTTNNAAVVERAATVARPVRRNRLSPWEPYDAAFRRLDNSGLPRPLRNPESNERDSLLPFTLIKYDSSIHRHLLIPNMDNTSFPSVERYQASVALYIPIVKALLTMLPAEPIPTNIPRLLIGNESSYATSVVFDVYYLVYFAPPAVDVEHLKALVVELMYRWKRVQVQLRNINNQFNEGWEQLYSESVRNAVRHGLPLTEEHLILHNVDCPRTIFYPQYALSYASSDKDEEELASSDEDDEEEVAPPSPQRAEITTSTITGIEVSSRPKEFRNCVPAQLDLYQISKSDLTSYFMSLNCARPWSSSSTSDLFNKATAMALRLRQGFTLGLATVPRIAAEIVDIYYESAQITGEIVRYLASCNLETCVDAQEDAFRLGWAARQIFSGTYQLFYKHKSVLLFDFIIITRQIWLKDVLPSVGDISEVPHFAVLGNGLSVPQINQLEELKESKGLFLLESALALQKRAAAVSPSREEEQDSPSGLIRRGVETAPQPPAAHTPATASPPRRTTSGAVDVGPLPSPSSPKARIRSLVKKLFISRFQIQKISRREKALLEGKNNFEEASTDKAGPSGAEQEEESTLLGKVVFVTNETAVTYYDKFVLRLITGVRLDNGSVKLTLDWGKVEEMDATATSFSDVNPFSSRTFRNIIHRFVDENPNLDDVLAALALAEHPSPLPGRGAEEEEEEEQTTPSPAANQSSGPPSAEAIMREILHADVSPGASPLRQPHFASPAASLSSSSAPSPPPPPPPPSEYDEIPENSRLRIWLGINNAAVAVGQAVVATVHSPPQSPPATSAPSRRLSISNPETGEALDLEAIAAERASREAQEGAAIAAQVGAAALSYGREAPVAVATAFAAQVAAAAVAAFTPGGRPQRIDLGLLGEVLEDVFSKSARGDCGIVSPDQENAQGGGNIFAVQAGEENGEI